MYCSQCGKKVMDSMLFCPFCGSPIVIPEQEEKKPAPAVSSEVCRQPDIPSETLQSEKSQADLSEERGATQEFVPLDVEQILNNSSPAQEAKTDIEREVSDTLTQQLQSESVLLQGHKPDLSAARPHSAPKIASRSKSDTMVPQRQFNPDDIFMDGEDEPDFEDYEEDFEFEEPEHSNFFIRHIRGFVSLIMFAIVAAVFLGWTFSSSGQQALARIGFAWRPSVYAEVAFEAYQSGSYATAGRYYSEALERDADRYEYANSAGVAYYMANDSFNAEIMARKAIDIQPSRTDAYELLLRLYPSAENRPLDIQAIFQKGYQLTGNEALKP